MKKCCKACGKEKERTEFSKGKRYKDGLRSWCKRCAADYSNKWSRDNIERKLRVAKQTTYGITEDEYYALFSVNKCGICGLCGEEQKRKHGQRLHIDHCHETGRVRGLLCWNCNTGLGRFNDDQDLLYRAIMWVRGETVRQLEMKGEV